MKKIILLLLASLSLLMVGPVDAKSKRSQAKQLELVQYKYAAAIRWNEFEMAWSHVDPVFRKEHPLSEMDKERLKQIQITGYEEKTIDSLEDGGIEQMVEIRLINRNTQVERIVMDTQVWRWDAVAKRWWLTTGLPDFSPKSF